MELAVVSFTGGGDANGANRTLTWSLFNSVNKGHNRVRSRCKMRGKTRGRVRLSSQLCGRTNVSRNDEEESEASI